MRIDDVDGTTFHPIEADFPLRKGWFYHEKDRGTTKCAAYLTKLYLSSVGNAATMNIGIAPNRDGLLDADDVKALAGFGVMRRALFAREARPGGPFNVVVMKEDVSNGEHVDGWRVLADGREILRGRSIGMKRIRLLAEPVAAGKCEVEVTAGGGKVELRRYIADAELVKTILEAAADGGETDTAKWMTAAAADLAAPAASASAGREESLEGAGWRFARDATGELRAEAPDFDDSSWRSVRIPHDWAISGPFDRTKPGGTGMLPWKGVGWYRRKFTLSAEDAAGCVYLDFDGVMASPEVYVNGEKAGGWDYGYASFRVDATPFVRAGVNTLAVRADTRHHDSRWYPGAGIYRRVSLKTRGKAHFAYNGVFATTPEVSADSATVDIAWELEGDVPGGASVEIHVAAPDSSMRLAASAPAAAGNVSWKMEKPRLWDVEAPNLYTAEARLVHGGHVLSSEKIRFGVRTIAFPVPLDGPAASDRAANGFHLNGRRVQFKGVNLHSDLGLLGMAFDESAARRQLKIMKEMGVNAVRTSHNIPAPQFLDLCDEMGILVWDECFDRWDGKCGRRADQKLEDYVARNLRAFVRRDRNHPCVVIWSMCNEILPASTDYFGPGGYKDGMTRERCRYFREQMRLEDRTRPVGNGNISWSDAPEFIGEGIFDDLDITGWNYHASYRNIKRMRPSKPVVYSESASCVSSQGACSERLPRGTYDHDVATFQASGYDFCGTEIPDWEFRRMEEDVYCCGEFVWTGFDYLGEPTPYNRESRSSYYGIVDLTGVPKDRYWLYRSHWNKEADTLHVVPHWTWPRSRGRKIPVFVYANADSVELFVNGRSAGRREKGVMYDGPGRPSSYYDVCANYRFMWYGVPYEPGELKAVAWRGGRIVGEKTVCTAGEPVALSAVAEPKLTDSPDELVWVGDGAIDSKGERCPAADARVSFSIEGPGEIVAVGNGNAHEFEPFTKTDSHPLFCGRAMAVVRRTGGGAIRLKVSAAGFVPAAVELP